MDASTKSPSGDENNKFKVVMVGNSEVGKTSLVKTLTLQLANSFDPAAFEANKCKPTVGMDFSKAKIKLYVAKRDSSSVDDMITPLEQDYREEEVYLHIHDTCGTEMADKIRRDKMRRDQNKTGSVAGKSTITVPEITSGYFRDAEAVLFCYELDHRESLNALADWNGCVVERPASPEQNPGSKDVKWNCVYFIVGTKLDKITNRGVPYEPGAERREGEYGTMKESDDHLSGVTGKILDPKRDVMDVQTTSAKTGHMVSSLFEEVAKRCYCARKGWAPGSYRCITGSQMRRLDLMSDAAKTALRDVASRTPGGGVATRVSSPGARVTVTSARSADKNTSTENNIVSCCGN